MSILNVVDLSRLQFATTAMYHFLFVPLTLGLSLLVAIMESVYVMTGRPVWREMTPAPRRNSLRIAVMTAADTANATSA